MRLIDVLKVFQEVRKQEKLEKKKRELDLFQSGGLNLQIMQDAINACKVGVVVKFKFVNEKAGVTTFMEMSNKDAFDALMDGEQEVMEML